MIRGVERYNPVLRRQVLGRAIGLAVLQHASFSISVYTGSTHLDIIAQHARSTHSPINIQSLLQVSFDLRRPVERLICPFPI